MIRYTPCVQRRCLKSIWVFLICLLTSAPLCSAWDVKYPSEEQTKIEGLKVVQSYLDLVIGSWKGKADTQKARFNLLSQEWFDSLELDQDICQLNEFLFEEYRILKVTNNYVLVKIINRSNGWSLELKYKVIVEDGIYRIQPYKFAVSREIPEITASVKFVTPHWTAGSPTK